ncbi:MAG TPA: hemerythrin domain-containing protein [Burkholderiaceae bacterium]|nr:hemerythrin domain-containing protein [Burkholderiaceae bacterium]
MNPITRRISPDAIEQIRADHTHVMAAFHQYRIDDRSRVRRALVDQICLALEVHATLEEEIFYPAMRDAAEDRDLVDDRLVPEQEEMRELIARLRSTDADDPSFDPTFMELMRLVIHHVAEEETVLLPDAERVLGREALQDVGARMTQRRVALMAPRAGEVMGSAVRAAPATTAMLVAGTLIGATYVARRAFAR